LPWLTASRAEVATTRPNIYFFERLFISTNMKASKAAQLEAAAQLRLRTPARSISQVVPLVFVAAVITVCVVIYIVCHLAPLLAVNRAAAQWQLHTFAPLCALLVICYIRAVTTSPGEVPDAEEWAVGAAAETGVVVQALEKKRTGERRACKWCGKYKPDRCHHCRVCRSCVLRMDHHCPWINNCVGFGNYKFFYLLLVYSAACCWVMCISMLSSVQKAVEVDTPFTGLFMLLFGETLAIFLGVVVSFFWAFHTWLLCSGMTTVEYCEKARKRPAGSAVPVGFDNGIYANLCGGLGPEPLLWLVPIGSLDGEGLVFQREKASLLDSNKLSSQSRRESRRGSGSQDSTAASDLVLGMNGSD